MDLLVSMPQLTTVQAGSGGVAVHEGPVPASRVDFLMSPQPQLGATRLWEADSVFPSGVSAPLDPDENTRFHEAASLSMPDTQQVEFGGCPEDFVGIEPKMW
ncbi:hypothetical protein [Arthrobacter sp. Y-9]|uniref:hypothetical protein n=1 Tax=Arthrobacter sp. Y-9 TaxID=3039385 RepID=UPI00241F432E|nr:hypothetical protein [Arthrobacter sp. Y-9]WFR85198.1 hypothetical protein P9849_06160 [Arthrobacter sp. Y-9]